MVTPTATTTTIRDNEQQEQAQELPAPIVRMVLSTLAALQLGDEENPQGADGRWYTTTEIRHAILRHYCIDPRTPEAKAFKQSRVSMALRRMRERGEVVCKETTGGLMGGIAFVYRMADTGTLVELYGIDNLARILDDHVYTIGVEALARDPQGREKLDPERPRRVRRIGAERKTLNLPADLIRRIDSHRRGRSFNQYIIDAAELALRTMTDDEASGSGGSGGVSRSELLARAGMS